MNPEDYEFLADRRVYEEMRPIGGLMADDDSMEAAREDFTEEAANRYINDTWNLGDFRERQEMEEEFRNIDVAGNHDLGLDYHSDTASETAAADKPMKSLAAGGSRSTRRAKKMHAAAPEAPRMPGRIAKDTRAPGGKKQGRRVRATLSEGDIAWTKATTDREKNRIYQQRWREGEKRRKEEQEERVRKLEEENTMLRDEVRHLTAMLAVYGFQPPPASL